RATKEVPMAKGRYLNPPRERRKAAAAVWFDRIGATHHPRPRASKPEHVTTRRLSMPDERLSVYYLLYFLLPLWLLAGFADWLCHRRARISLNAGPKESLLHLLMLLEVSVPLLLALFFE